MKNQIVKTCKNQIESCDIDYSLVSQFEKRKDKIIFKDLFYGDQHRKKILRGQRTNEYIVGGSIK